MNLKDLFIPQCPGGNHAIKAVKGTDSPLVCKTCGTKLKRAFRFDLNRFLVAVSCPYRPQANPSTQPAHFFEIEALFSLAAAPLI